MLVFVGQKFLSAQLMGRRFPPALAASVHSRNRLFITANDKQF